MLRKLAAFTLLVAACPAATIFDQGPPNDNSIDITSYRAADDFRLLSSATLTGINFWYQAQFPDDLSQVTYAFYNDVGGAIGSLIISGTASPTVTTDTNAYLATLAIAPLDLAAGTYWLELHAGSSLTSDNGELTVWWSTAADNATSQLLYGPAPDLPVTPGAATGFEQFAFQLEGTGTTAEVPEPAAASLAAIGLGILWIASRRSSGSRSRI